MHFKRVVKWGLNMYQNQRIKDKINILGVNFDNTTMLEMLENIKQLLILKSWIMQLNMSYIEI